MIIVMVLAPLTLLLSSVPAGKGEVEVDLARKAAPISSGLYGVFLEDINNAVEGGLYAEMVQNRGFEDASAPPGCTLEGPILAAPKNPSFWEGYSKDFTMPWPYAGQGPAPGWTISGCSWKVVSDRPLTAANPHALELDARPGAAASNRGFWGMGVQKGRAYDLSVFVQPLTYKGGLEARLTSADGRVLAKAALPRVQGQGWKKVSASLTASSSDPGARLSLVALGTGRLLLDMASLMPREKWRGLPLRRDLADMIASLKPSFVRWPGGCVSEGITIETRPQWEQTVGPQEGRTPTFIPWGYWMSNGFGYHEFLLTCEALGAEPLYVANAGISCAFRSGTFLSGQDLDREIEKILGAIEYAKGPASSKYGAMRARAGHPKPFKMSMIEIGNEAQGPKYGRIFKKIAAAVKARHPEMKTILSSWISGIDHAAISEAGPQLDIVDEHAYRPVNWAIQNFDSFASYPRGTGWDLYIGEFATNSGVGRGSVRAMLGDAAYMMSMEKNGDLVKMGSYAPLLENVNRRQWEVNLIHFDSTRAFGRASYYACRLFAENLPAWNHPVKTAYAPSGESPVRGRIGLGSYRTSVEYRDIRVDGQPVSGALSKEGGRWSESNGVISQTDQEADDVWAYLGEDRENYTLSLKARRISGAEGFVVSVGRADGRRVQLNIGGWNNTQNALEAEGVLRRSRGRVEDGVWHDVRIVVRGRRITAFLDEKQLFDVDIPRIDTVLAVAGRDSRTGEVILKLVNSSLEPAEVAVSLRGGQASGSALLTELGSSDPDAENSFDAPRKVVPAARRISFSGSRPVVTLKPCSLTILRFKTK